MAEFDALYQALRQIGEDPARIITPETSFLVAYGHDLIGLQAAPGVELLAQPGAEGIVARVTVQQGRHIETPVHLCFGCSSATACRT